MDHLKVIIKVMQQGDWAVLINLTDAYMHIPIRQSHQRFLRFAVDNQVWQFRALPFGPTTAPRIFTKLVSVVVQYLRQQRVQIWTYLDDWILTQNPNQLLAHRDLVLNTLVKLGFLPNLIKSDLVPSQDVNFIGARFLLKEGFVTLPQDRAQILKETVKQILNQPFSTAYLFLRLLGLMTACLQVIPWARLQMRPIQLFLLAHWRPSRREIWELIPIKDHLIPHLRWWLEDENLFPGVPLNETLLQITLTTDASMLGWGATCNLQTCQGCWNVEQKTLHINILEMEAVIQSVLHFHTLLKGKVILLRGGGGGGGGGDKIPISMHEDMAVVQNSQGDVLHDHCYSFGRHKKCRSRSLVTSQSFTDRMVSEFFSSATDILVSGQPSNRPVCLRSKSLSSNFLFLETQCESSSNRRFHSGLVRNDSLRLSTNLSLSPGPSTSRESRMYSDSDSSILAQEGLVHEIAQPDSRYTTDSTRQERPSETTYREIFPPKSQSFPLGSMENPKQPLSTTDFSEGVEKLVEASLREGTRKDYKAKFQRYQNWCLGRGLYPRSAPLKYILEFLAELHQEGLAYNTLCGYRSVLSLYHNPIDGLSLGSHPLIWKLLKGVFNLNPPLKKFCPEWEVSIVLVFLTRSLLSQLRTVLSNY